MLLFISLVRLLIPWLVFVSPLVGIVVSLFGDGIDYEIWLRTTTAGHETYQAWDKLLDLYTLSVYLAFVVHSWNHTSLKRIAIGLFGWRVIGIMVFEVWPVRALLFFFPNIFEVFFIGVEIIKRWWPDLLESKRSLIFFLIAITLLKEVQEYFTHVIQTYPWQWRSGQLVLGDAGLAHYVNAAFWVGLFVGLHLVVVTFLRTRSRYEL